MRNLLLVALLAGLTTAAQADGPPGSIVIRPQTGAAAPSSTQPRPPAVAHTDPMRPGFLIVKPQSVGTTQQVLRQDAPAPATPAPGAKPQPKGKLEATTQEDGRIVLETWDAISIKGMRVGYFHVLVREYEREGQKYLYATKAQRIWVARFGQVVDQWAEDFSMETPDGAVLVNRVRQGIGRDQMLTLEGKVKGNKLNVKIEGQVKDEKEVPWFEGVLGVAKEATIFADKKPKPGDTFSYLVYEGRVTRVVKFNVVVEKYETLSLTPGAPLRKLLRSTVAMEPIGDFKLPAATLWCDATTFEPLKMESDVPSFGGLMTVIRTDKQTATRPVGKVPDLFEVQSIRLNQKIPNIHAAAAVTYKVTAPKDVAADKVFPADDRQIPRNFDPETKTVELTVTGPPADAPAVPAPGPEYLSSNFFIDWDNAQVKQHAREAVAGLPAGATDLQKARAVERWVHTNMKSTEFSQAMATCSNVARTLSGDCSEYSMLSAGMCRALGIPSRTALGVVYAEDRQGKPFLAYHVWFEVYAGGRWVSLDATLGLGRVGPGHLKITDAHWHDEKSFAPLLPVLAVLQTGPKVEVLR